MLKFIEQFKDPYERKARVTPGLLAVLPVLVSLVSAYGPKHAVLTGVLGVLGGCGAIFALANFARGQGKKLEEDLVKQWGGMPTTIILRHRDSYLDRYTKQRYHEAIRTKLGIPIPTEADEIADPTAADKAYMAATKRLRELTRGDTKLLLKENIAYGFQRNMTAMKPVAIVTCILGLGHGLLATEVLRPISPFVDLSRLKNVGISTEVSFLVSSMLLSAWLFYFKPAAIRRVGNAYAERLFEQLSALRGTIRKIPIHKKSGDV